MAEAAEQSLYARLGGYDAIAAAVDDLLPRLTSRAFCKFVISNGRLLAQGIVGYREQSRDACARSFGKEAP
jgi:hypothetical protein